MSIPIMYILICFQTISAKYLLFLLNPNPFFQNVIHSSKYYWLNYPFTKKKPSSKYWSVFPKFDPFSRKLFVLLYILIHFKKMLSILPKWDPFFQTLIHSSKKSSFLPNTKCGPNTDPFFKLLICSSESEVSWATFLIWVFDSIQKSKLP